MSEYVAMKNTDVERLPFVKHAVIVGTNVKSLEVEFNGKTYLFDVLYSDMRISEPRPDEIVQRYVVVGTINGLEIKPKNFESRKDAQKLIDETDEEKHLLKIETRDWNLTQQSYVEGESKASASDSDEIPF